MHKNFIIFCVAFSNDLNYNINNFKQRSHSAIKNNLIWTRESVFNKHGSYFFITE